MSCVCILTPIVIAAWPAFSAAVSAAAVSLGYTVVEEGIHQHEQSKVTRAPDRSVKLEIEQSEIVTGQLGRDQKIRVMGRGVTVAFSRDTRGRAAVCVEGPGFSEEELRTMGEQLAQRVVQTYVHRRLLDEIHARQFIVVEEEIDESHAIRLKVRHWG